jgi:release factor glutamine methyltransferase
MRQSGSRVLRMHDFGGTVRAALASATKALSRVSDTARLDAELLTAYALNVDRGMLIQKFLDAPAPFGLDTLIERRLAHEPIAYITGERDFWTMTLRVAPGVLIPRPDSETLIEAAIDHFGDHAPKSVLDLGTGSGALLLAALCHWPQTAGVGVDCSAVALEIARANVFRLGIAGRALFRHGDWAEDIEAQFDLILCNPPYVETSAALAADVLDYEPHGALFAGVDGLDAYRRIAPQLQGLLALGGCAAIEIGHEQAEPAGTLFQAQGFKVAVRQDLGKRDRCLVLTREGDVFLLGKA